MEPYSLYVLRARFISRRAPQSRLIAGITRLRVACRRLDVRRGR